MHSFPIVIGPQRARRLLSGPGGHIAVVSDDGRERSLSDVLLDAGERLLDESRRLLDELDALASDAATSKDDDRPAD